MAAGDLVDRVLGTPAPGLSPSLTLVSLRFVQLHPGPGFVILRTRERPVHCATGPASLRPRDKEKPWAGSRSTTTTPASAAQKRQPRADLSSPGPQPMPGGHAGKKKRVWCGALRSPLSLQSGGPATDPVVANDERNT
jgi:hypothetical protein